MYTLEHLEMNDIDLGIKQVETLIKTLNQQARDNKIRFSIKEWFVLDDLDCGTCCCICGSQALTNNLEFFPRAQAERTRIDNLSYEQAEVIKDKNESYHTQICWVSDAIAWDLIHTIGEELAKSIYDLERQRPLDDFCVLLKDYSDNIGKDRLLLELKNHSHILKSRPSIEVAISYLSLVLILLKQLKDLDNN